MRQPFFIGGIEDVEKAKNSAFGAAGTFFVVFLISIIYLISGARFNIESITASRPGSRPPSRIPSRHDYDLVSAVQDYHADDIHEDEHGQFT